MIRKSTGKFCVRTNACKKRFGNKKAIDSGRLIDVGPCECNTTGVAPTPHINQAEITL